VLARQQAARDRVVGDDAHAFLEAEREHFPFDLAEEQVVAGLHAVQPRQPERLGAPDRPYQLVGQEVRAAGVPDLAGVDQIIQRAQGLVDRRRPVISVQLVQVDVVGLQPPQRGVDGRHDVLAGVAAVKRRRPGRGEALGGHDEPVPLAPQPAAEDLLGDAPRAQVPAQRVRIGAIEKVDAPLRGPVQDRDRRTLVAL
jgi:hypothetical protein